MKKGILEFCRRGIVACGFGPLVLAVFYLLLQQECDVQTLTVDQVCLGIFSLWLLAFVAGGMNMIYRIERLPLIVAIFIHCGVLYVCYLATYLINGWLEQGILPILVFSVIFVVGFLAIWAVIYSIVKRNTKTVNEQLRQKQRDFGKE